MMTMVAEKPAGIMLMTLDEHAHSIGIKLDKADNMWRSAVEEAQDVLTTEFGGDRDKFKLWYCSSVDHGDLTPHRAWSKLDGHLKYVQKRMDRGMTLPEALDSREKRLAREARYEESHYEERHSGRRSTPEPRRFEANVAEVKVDRLEIAKAAVENLPKEEITQFDYWYMTRRPTLLG